MDQLLTFSISRQNAEPDTTIRVNNEEVAVNKCVLALSSIYFQRYFFDDRYPVAENIELPESTTVEDFKRMIAVLPPEQRELDVDHIEAILILADRFAMDNVLELCRKLLIASSKPKLYKYRIAHKYGLGDVEPLQVKDFGENFVENATEFAMLDDHAKAAFTSHLARISTARFGARGGRVGSVLLHLVGGENIKRFYTDDMSE